MMFLNIVKFLIYPWAWFLFPTVFKGKRNIPKGKAIFVCNHTSNADPVVLILSTWRKQYFLAKKELFKNWFMRGLMKFAHAISIDRSKTDLKAMKNSIKVLNKGKVLTIFPEGTRNKTGADLSEVKAGAGMFAIKTKTPIVPVWIKRKPMPFVPNVLQFGKPFTLDEFYDQKLNSETMEKVGEVVAEKLLENKIEPKKKQNNARKQKTA